MNKSNVGIVQPHIIMHQDGHTAAHTAAMAVINIFGAWLPSLIKHDLLENPQFDDDFARVISIYPLVNSHILPQKDPPIFHGKIHYFYGHVQ